jgi:multiple sugar transport system ATP-binding protein
MADVTLRQVRKVFGNTEVISGIDLDIQHNELTVFVGPSGCGKSTLLRLIAGLEDLSGGELYIDGQQVDNLPPARRGVAMVFQSYALYPHMNVYQNMAFGLRLAKADKRGIEQRVRRAAGILQIAPLLARKPAELSGGQRQRVAIGRAIVRDPKVFLFDEPLSNLDAALRVQMRIELARLKSDLAATMVYVTHDQVEAMTLANNMVVLNNGRVEQVGAPLDLYHRPQNRFVAGFIGSPRMNFLQATVQALDEHSVTVAIPGAQLLTIPVRAEGAEVGASVVLGIRPEHFTAEHADIVLHGEVLVVERLGSETYLYLRLQDGQQATVEAYRDTSVNPGDVVEVGVAAISCHLFDSRGNALHKLEWTP